MRVASIIIGSDLQLLQLYSWVKVVQCCLLGNYLSLQVKSLMKNVPTGFAKIKKTTRFLALNASGE
jgi:hypothetical protein